MAKKKNPGGRPKGSTPPREMIAAFRGSAEFRDWFWQLVNHCRTKSGWPDTPASSVIERALHSLAKEEGFDVEPPKR